MYLLTMIITFISAITAPSCEPDCGPNAHCAYGQVNSCKCNKGFTGNPYINCMPRKQITCASAFCGRNAVCQQTKAHIECLCPPGYIGNPNIQCVDIDECSSKPCAENAVCLNTPGSYSCICKSRYVGNPYELCSQVSISKCTEGSICTCSHNATCPAGFICEKSRCINVCKNIMCGPNAFCEEGKCICTPGYSGNAYDVRQGCKSDGKCTTDGDCQDSEICFQLAKNLRKCVESCSKTQCGPNTVCISSNHRANCICAEGFIGKPSDVQRGCYLAQKEPNEMECYVNDDCSERQVCITVDGATNRCLDLCSTIACSANELCKVNDNIPRCYCNENFIWNPVTSTCEQPSTPNCKLDSDCKDNESCSKDVLGVNKCVDECSFFTCPENSKCVSENHKGRCECLPEFGGNPNKRDGCVLINKNQCTDDVQCKETEICKRIGNIKKCQTACERISCGPNAFCVTKNHVAQCQCLPGPFTGNPKDLVRGCQPVPCVYNSDCEGDKLCNRLSHSCDAVCDEETCGENAICIAENHKPICQCPNGYKANPLPEVKCSKIESCNSNSCHSTAICEQTATSFMCKCPQGYSGDPYENGCRVQEECTNKDTDCATDSVCKGGRCANPCDGACGVNSLCRVVNKKPICICPEGYENVQDGSACKKRLLACSNEMDCEGDVCSNGQCFRACGNATHCDHGETCLKNLCITKCSKHSHCGMGQACVRGQCILGCRNNADCPSDESCTNNQCVNSCLATKVCGPNAICSRKDHTIECECPLGFEGLPSARQGCVRKSSPCERSSQCPPDHMCIGHRCQVPCREDSGCAIGEKCNDHKCHKICHSSSNCLHGEHCSFGVCVYGCKGNSDCQNSQVCESGKCECQDGFVFNGQECENVNECIFGPCHPSAQCVDTFGSYKCVCATGTVGDPNKTGCLLPNQCNRDDRCEDSLICINGKCSNPCETNLCGTNAICSVSNHRVSCDCPKGYVGNSTDKAVGCFKVQCVDDMDCPENKLCNSKINKCSGIYNKFLIYLHLIGK